MAEVQERLRRVEEREYTIRRGRSGVEDEVLEGGTQVGELGEARSGAWGVCGGGRGGEVQVGEGAAELLEDEDGELVEGDSERAEARERAAAAASAPKPARPRRPAENVDNDI